MSDSKNSAETFILGHSKLSDDGTSRTVTQSDYLKLVQEQHNIEPGVVKALAVAQKDIVSGAIAVATADLANAIAAAKKNGDDPRELEADVRISQPGGAVTVGVIGERTTTNPKTGDKIINHGVVSVKVRSKTLIDPDAAKDAREKIAKLIG